MPATKIRKRRRGAAKIAISLPHELLRSVESLRRRTGESRSAVIRRSLEMLLDRLKDEAMVRAYVEGYLAHPETPEEIEEADTAAEGPLAEEPWE